MIRVCVLGPSGRMGAAVIAEVGAADDAVVASAVDRAECGAVGQPVTGAQCNITDDLSEGMGQADVYIDFTTPAATRAAAEAAREKGVAAVIGTTGLTDVDRAAVDELAKIQPVVVAPNFSLGVNLILHLAELAARALGPDFDAEVVELHHRHKRDAPSGTALALGEALARGRDVDFDKVGRLSREGEVGARTDDEIGVVAVRGGSIVGEHTAYLIGERERIEISHRASSRSIFAGGAVHAAKWVVGHEPGLYSMRDVLGL